MAKQNFRNDGVSLGSCCATIR